MSDGTVTGKKKNNPITKILILKAEIEYFT